jgi:hypothetical protein
MSRRTDQSGNRERDCTRAGVSPLPGVVNEPPRIDIHLLVLL